MLYIFSFNKPKSQTPNILAAQSLVRAVSDRPLRPLKINSCSLPGHISDIAKLCQANIPFESAKSEAIKFEKPHYKM